MTIALKETDTNDVMSKEDVTESNDQDCGSCEFNVSHVDRATSSRPTIAARAQLEKFKRQEGKYHRATPPLPFVHGLAALPPVLKDGYRHGFLNAAVTAFAEHHPLSLKCDHFWLLVLQAISQHVGANAEELRERFVSHAGKKELVIILDHFVLGSERNDWTEAIGMFGNEIQANVAAGVAEMTRPGFTTTTLNDQTAAMATLMKMTEQYFDFTMVTRCGIPTIMLEGSPSDWLALRHRVKELVRAWCLPDFAEKWLAALLPVLDTMAATSSLATNGQADQVDVTFWESFVKRGSVAGSGGGTYISGWINVFFPYDKDDRWNNWCKPYIPGWEASLTKERRRGMLGMDHTQFPSGVSKVPVMWLYYDEEIPLQFWAGFLGATQKSEEEGLVLRPEVGWAVLDADSKKEKKR